MLRSTTALVLLGIAVAVPSVLSLEGRAQSVVATSSPEAVIIPMADGTRVIGRFTRSGDGSRGAVLFSMCSRNAIDGWTPIVDRLAAAGISSLAVTSPTPRPAAPGPAGTPVNTRAADADAIIADAARRLAPGALLAVGGGSCGVHLALLAATRHPDVVRAAVVVSGPYDDDLLARINQLPLLAMFSGASRSEGPAIGWAEALRSSSKHAASRVLIREGRAHGTEMFVEDTALASDVAACVAEQLR